MSDSRKTLLQLVQARRALLLPGAFNALSAALIQDLGFEAVYLSGAGLSNMHLGLPDQGFLGLTDLVEHTQRVRERLHIPLLVDADTGFGNALNVYHTVRQLERAGADAVQLEDQTAPKRCGHFNGKHVISSAEMVGKIKAAVDARQDSGLLVVARTDAAAVHGFQAAVERASLYAEAGADVLFVEALREPAELRALPALLDKPLLMNLVLGGQTPLFERAELERLGYALVLYANAALQSALAGMSHALTELRQHGVLAQDPALLVSFAERQRLVDKPAWDRLEQRYAER